MGALTTDDLKEMRHIVIVETDTSLRLIEFDHGKMGEAHQAAINIATSPDFDGRVIVVARVRQIGSYAYQKRHNISL